MEFHDLFRICGSGLKAQRIRMEVITSNLANAHTTKTPEGGPYQRKIAVFGSRPVGDAFGDQLGEALKEVELRKIEKTGGGFKTVYDPSHPDASADGTVMMPNVNVITEMTEMISANRSYEACVTAFDAVKSMALKALEIGK
jgi:flagellar basal-body rod protein FlgC